MRRLSILASLLLVAGLAQAHVGNHPSVHDTVAAIIERFARTFPAEELKASRSRKYWPRSRSTSGRFSARSTSSFA